MGVCNTTIGFLLVIVSFLGRLHLANAVGPFGWGKKEKHPDVNQREHAFARIQYRPHRMARYITRSKAWQEGRRDILDWGCGGGGLAQALAKAGANKVVAVDMNFHAINSTEQLLEPFDNAIAQLPRRQRQGPVGWLFGPAGPAGQIGYTSSFDTVVSFCGALSIGSTSAPRIDTETAMKQAHRACREGGTVIVGHMIAKLSEHYLRLLALVLAAAFAWKYDALWLWGRPEYIQYGIWYAMSLPFLGIFHRDVLFIIILKNLSRSFGLREWRISSILWGIFWLMDFVSGMVVENR